MADAWKIGVTTYHLITTVDGINGMERESSAYDLEICDLCYRRDPDCPSYHRGLSNAIPLKKIVFDVFAELAAANSTRENTQVLLGPCFLLSGGICQL